LSLYWWAACCSVSSGHFGNAAQAISPCLPSWAAPFYGGFPVRSMEDRESFMDALKGGDMDYVIVLPGRMRKDMTSELASRAELVYRDSGDMRREIELWKMHSYP
jgi:hypothetical protein